jgi:hypothetical protein
MVKSICFLLLLVIVSFGFTADLQNWGYVVISFIWVAIGYLFVKSLLNLKK